MCYKKCKTKLPELEAENKRLRTKLQQLKNKLSAAYRERNQVKRDSFLNYDILIP